MNQITIVTPEPRSTNADGSALPSLRDILAPVAADVSLIDDVLRRNVDIDVPLLGDAVEAIIQAGGKRLRPTILFMVAKFNSYELDKLVPMSAAIELLHTATLVHDDTLDQALMRRGLPTLNSLIDQGTTVLVGDYLFAKSAVLSTMGGSQRATRIFAESLVTICEGEIEQKFATHSFGASVDDYLSRIYCKTAVLFAAAGEIGGVLSEAPEDQVQKFRTYGRQMGMAFQIVDDILDMQSTAEQLGKPVGGDLRQGTVTLPTMLFLRSAPREQRDLVKQVIEGNERDDASIAGVIELVSASSAFEEAHAMAQTYVAEAKLALNGLPDVPVLKSLTDLADFAIRRSF